MPAYEVFGDPMTTDASVMAGGEAGPNVARALSEVARLPVDMAAWDKFTDQGVTVSLCRRLMMVSFHFVFFHILCYTLMPNSGLLFLYSGPPGFPRVGQTVPGLSCPAAALPT